jgi:hypothetical protein
VGDLAFLADYLGEAFEFLRHLLIERDDLVEEAGDLSVDSVSVLGQANAEIAATERSKRADELAAIDEVTLGLDVHSTLRVAFLPRPGCAKAAPRPPDRFMIIGSFALRFLKMRAGLNVNRRLQDAHPSG